MSEKKTLSSMPQPGVLRSETALEVQTRQAQRLVYGRRAKDGKPAIIGLMRFATMLRVIWQGASVDDPWADWRLIQIENELLSGRDSLQSLQTRVEKQLTHRRAIEVSVAHSVEPVKINLTFTNPYGFMAAYLLADYDILVRSILTGRHIGLFDRDTTERMLSEGGRIVRRTCGSAHGYRYLNVCREDVRQGTRKATRAKEMLGALPQEVVDGTLRAAHAPDIRPVSSTPTMPAHLLDSDEDAEDDNTAKTRSPEVNEVEVVRGTRR